jgi:exonuclease III
MDLRFGTWNVRSLHRAGSLKTLVSELAKYKFDLVTVQEVRWDEGVGSQQTIIFFFYGNGDANHHLGLGSFVH